MIDHFFYQLNALKQNKNKTIVQITNVILDILNNNKTSATAKQIAQRANISLSMLTKYTKMAGYENINEILFLIKEAIAEEQNRHFLKTSDIYKEIAERIWNCRKIQFVGRGNAYVINNDFRLKLERLDLWAMQSNSKYEEEGHCNLLNEKDLIIINSVTMQHQYIFDIIKKSRCKVLVITNSTSFKPKNKNIWVIKYKVSGIENKFNRIYTIEARNSVLKIFDNIFTEIIKMDGAIELLKLSRYK